jgi:hypothetical protein
VSAAVVLKENLLDIDYRIGFARKITITIGVPSI